MSNAIQWFEIPAQNLDRAFEFYHYIFNGKVKKGNFGGGEIILFDVPFSTGEAVGGSIILSETHQSGTTGPVIYLNAFGSLSDCLKRVVEYKGEIIQDLTDLGKFGFSAIIIDSEGNKIGIISNEK